MLLHKQMVEYSMIQTNQALASMFQKALCNHVLMLSDTCEEVTI